MNKTRELSHAADVAETQGRDFNSLSRSLVEKMKKGDKIGVDEIEELKMARSLAEKAGNDMGEVAKQQVKNVSALQADQDLGKKLDWTSERLVRAIEGGDVSEAEKILSEDTQTGKKAEDSASDLVDA